MTQWGNKIKDFWDELWNGVKDAVNAVKDAVNAVNDVFSFDAPEGLELKSYPIPTPTPVPTEKPVLLNPGGDNSLSGESYLESGMNVAENRTNTEECALLDIAGCQVETYDMSYVVEFIKKFESFSATPYYATDDEKERGILTIGYGHVIKEDEKTTYTIQYIMSEEEASSVLKEDIKGHFPTDIMEKVLEVHGPITQNQLDALVALRFNNGYFSVDNSPNFTNILVNEDYSNEDVKQLIVNEFMTYNKQDGEILGGLVKRSTAEAILFLENNYFTDYDDLYSDPKVIKQYKEFLEKYGWEELIEYLE